MEFNRFNRQNFLRSPPCQNQNMFMGNRGMGLSNTNNSNYYTPQSNNFYPPQGVNWTGPSYCEPCSNGNGPNNVNNCNSSGYSGQMSQEAAMTRSVLDCLPVYPPCGHPTPGSPSSYNCMRQVEELQQPIYPTMAEFNNYYAHLEGKPC